MAGLSFVSIALLSVFVPIVATGAPLSELPLIEILEDSDPEDIIALEIEDSEGQLAAMDDGGSNEGTAVGNGTIEERDWLRFRVTGGVKVTVPTFNVGARVGVEGFGGVLEAGLEGEIMPIIALFYGGGAYAKLTPVPFGMGRRFYLVTRAGRLWVKSPEGGEAPVSHFDNLGLGLGYRQALEGEGGGNGREPYWYVELGAQRTRRIFRENSSCHDAEPAGDCWNSKITPSVTAGAQF